MFYEVDIKSGASESGWRYLTCVWGDTEQEAVQIVAAMYLVHESHLRARPQGS